MPRKKTSDSAAPNGGDAAATFRFDAKRKNIPSAGLEAQGKAQDARRIRYEFNPHLPPTSRSAVNATGTDRLPSQLETARRLAPDRGQPPRPARDGEGAARGYGEHFCADQRWESAPGEVKE